MTLAELAASKRFRHWSCVALAAILLLAAGLRWYGLTQRPFFFDELWITELSNGHGSEFMDIPIGRLIDQPNLLQPSQARPIWQIPAHTTGAIHPPGTFIALRLWRDVFGDSMFSLRSFPATCSMAAIVLIYIVALISFGRGVACWAALLACLSPANVAAAQDVRGYPLIQVLWMLGILALLHARRGKQPALSASLIAVAALAMMFTHYFAAGAGVALGAGALLLLRGRVRWLTLLALAIAAIVWSILWLPHLRAQFAYVPDTADIFLLDDSQGSRFSVLLRLMASPLQALISDLRTTRAATVVGGEIIVLMILWSLARRRSGDRRLVIFWIIAVASPLAVLLAVDVIRHTRTLEQGRYLAIANPGLCVLLASLYRGGKTWLWPAMASATLVILSFVTLAMPQADLRPQLAWLHAHAMPDDVIILPSYNPQGRDAQVTYLHLAYELPWPSHRIVVLTRPASPDLVESLPRSSRWFVLSFDVGLDPRAWLPGTHLVSGGPRGSAAVYGVAPG